MGDQVSALTRRLSADAAERLARSSGAEASARVLEPAAAVTPVPATRDPAAKGRHLEVCRTEAVEYCKRTGLESFEFRNQALPELSLRELDISTRLGPWHLPTPLMIAPMTGGTPEGLALNRLYAVAAERFGLAMGVGSQRVGIEHPDRARWYRVRDVAPSILLFANIGAGQLARGWGCAEALKAVQMIEADALFVHFNPVQEAVQGGDRDFRDIAKRLATLCGDLASEGIPVFAREVCFGLSEDAARRLVECGVAGLDCSGAGGTSWAKVEAFCAKTPRRRAMGLRFGEWGIPTARSIRNVRRASSGIPLIASGGLRTGIDLAKVLALGADVGAMARPFLLQASESEAALHAFIEDLLDELRICMFGSGAGSVAALRERLDPVSPSVAGDI
ncbi:MAG: type 2 isopentenyl-diphosphate Delta-isomerase [Burkholderiales bacterium]|nr:type 2 isopentenyl-diphosphate Delta-isomerase [Burkholderiales bacterium]